MSAKKMGRPLSDNPKSKKIEIRVDQEILSKLDACTEKLQTTRSDVIRKGIEKVFDELQN
ncbi:CopG family transcriptional regulator [Paenibacillus sp. FSL R7-0204]|uniref:CopG family transcriptional regulator n=1 Tax=Paenibacillus sp. FSL R7-0204 TaxID=2921675 RepID=UPI0030FC7F42